MGQRKPGKREPGQADVNAALSGSDDDGYLLYVHDDKSKRRWLIDSGALLSIIPPTLEQKRDGPNGIKLSAANGTEIPCYGTELVDVAFGGRIFPTTVTVADVRQPILGADFLAANHLAPDQRYGNLIDLETWEIIDAHFDKCSSPTRINYVDQRNDPYYQLLDKYPELSVPQFRPDKVKHNVKHYIPTTGHPIQARARKLNPEKLAVAKAEIEKLVELGIAKRAKSEWTSPLVVARKPCVTPCKCTPTVPCGGWRVCGDFRRLNTVTVDDKYPVKSISDFNANLAGKKIFSKIDLLKGYHQIPVNEEDVKKTGLITPFGLFVFPFTPFGLKNAGQDFQRMMDELLGDLPFCFVYIDDILVASDTPEQHLEHLKQVFEILKANGLVVNRKKCELGKSSLQFLGYKVDKDGVYPMEHRVEAIKNTTRPTTVKELQRFLGMVNYYRKWIPQAAHHASPLFDALKSKPKVLAWSCERQKAFDAVKKALSAKTMLSHPRPNAPLAITSDASNIAVGAVLEQLGPQGWEPLGFFSKRLQENQQEWPPFDRELKAAFEAIRHFRHMVEGQSFTLYTDHQSLVPALYKKTEPQTARQTYQLSAIAEFTTDIRYLEGKANVVADALSRPNEVKDDEPTIEPIHQDEVPTEKVEDLNAVIAAVDSYGIDMVKMARDQALDPDFQRMSREARTGLHFKKVDIGDANIIVDVSNGPARPYVPQTWRRRIFDIVHGLGHPGVQRTREAVAAKFVWPGMRHEVGRWARECIDCQRAKVTRHIVPNIGEFEVPNKRFSHLHADIVYMPTSNGFSYLLTVTDRFTRWATAVPLRDISAESVVDALSHGWIASFGIPKAITTDRGSQFNSAVWNQLLELWGIEHHQTTAYHPEANGLVERMHRRLKEALIALVRDERENWYWKLPCALLSINTTVKPDIGASPAELVYGEGLALPGSVLPSFASNDQNVLQQQQNLLANMRLEVERLQPTATSAHRRPHVHVPEEVDTATHVFVQRGGVQPTLTSPYEGPFGVVGRTEHGMKVNFPGKGTETVALARIKPAFVSSEQDETGDESQDPDNEAPSSPPPPANQHPPASDRRTHSAPPAPPLNPTLNPDPLAYDPGEGTSAQARARTRAVSPDEEDDYLSRLRRLRNWGPPSSDSDDENDSNPQSKLAPPVAIPAPVPGTLSPAESSDREPANLPPQRFFTSGRRRAPHIADFNRLQRFRSRPFKQEPPPPLQPPTQLPLAITPHPSPVQGPSRHRQRPSKTSARQNDSLCNDEPVAARPGTVLNYNQNTLPLAVTPHPRPVQNSDLSKRRRRPNVNFLQSILKDIGKFPE